MSSRDPTVNVTYGIMTMLYLTTVVVLNTLNIRLYEQEVLIPLQQGPVQAPAKAQAVEKPKFTKITLKGPEMIDVVVGTPKDKVPRPGVTTDIGLTVISDWSNLDTSEVGKLNTIIYTAKDVKNNIKYDSVSRIYRIVAAPEAGGGQQQSGGGQQSSGDGQQQQFTNIENFGNITSPQETTIETTSVRTTKINKEAVAITESILMGVTLPLAFGYIIGFDCSCPPNSNHVGKIIFCLGVFIPIIFIIVNEIIGLLFPDIDILNPFLPPGSSETEGKKHFFNKQYRKTICWCIITLTFIIHFFSVAFGQSSGVGSVDII